MNAGASGVCCLSQREPTTAKMENMMIPCRPRRFVDRFLIAIFAVAGPLTVGSAVAADRPDVVIADFEGETYGDVVCPGRGVRVRARARHVAGPDGRDRVSGSRTGRTRSSRETIRPAS